MEEERSFATRTLKVVGFGLLAFAITILVGGIWSALLVTNLRSSPAAPWSVPAMALLLWLYRRQRKVPVLATQEILGLL